MKTSRDQSALAPSLRCWSAMRAVLSHPHPCAFDERLAAEVLARQAFFGEFAFDDVLGGDAGVVFAGQPERRVALHAVPADEMSVMRLRARGRDAARR